MATSQKIDGIQFNRIMSEGGYPLPGAPLRWVGPNGEYWSGVESGSGGIINGIDIDWNDAKLGKLSTGEEIIIQTTGQLLSYMSTIAQKITNLENILLNL